jgi:hypothetical protein
MAFKIDFGRVFPGLLIILVGLCLLALWFVLAVLSFFVYFIPGGHWFFYVALDVGIASLLVMGIGALVALTGVSGWSWRSSEPRSSGTGWVQRRVDKDRLRVSERFGELFGIVISLLFLLFFYENQVRNTGFFTSSFGPTEQALFYGSWVFGALVMLARAAYGRRNAMRPLEATQDLLLAFTAFFLLEVFPFSFSHLPDLLPNSIQFMFVWVNNDIGALALTLMGVGSLAAMMYNSVLYVSVRSELRADPFRV